MQYSEDVILSALTSKALYMQYRAFIKPQHFSSRPLREMCEKIYKLHARSSGDKIAVNLFKLELPKIDEDTILPVVEDFALRCNLNDKAREIIKKLNTNDLLKFPDDISFLENKEVVASEDLTQRIVKFEKKEEAPTRYSIGFAPLDAALDGGIAEGELCIVAAPPHGGKTHWLIYFTSALIDAGHDVYHFILEDLSSDISQNYRETLDKRRKLDNFTLLDYNDTFLSCYKLSAIIDELLLRRTNVLLPPVIVVDYADILSDRMEDEVIRLRNIFRDLRRIANKYGAIVLSGSQADAEAWGARRVTMRNLSGSKVGKASMADVIIFFSQLESEKTYGDGRLIVAKARGRRNKTPIIPVNVDWESWSVEA